MVHVAREMSEIRPFGILEGSPIVKENVVLGRPTRLPMLFDDRSRSLVIGGVDQHTVPLAHLPSFWHHLLFGTLLLFNLGSELSRNATNPINRGK